MAINTALIIDGPKTAQASFHTLLADLNITLDIAESITEAWQLIKQGEEAYGLVFVSRCVFDSDLKDFVSQLRSLRNYSSVPLILLIDNSEERDAEFIYATGFTQIFSRTEPDVLRAYIVQAQGRNTFERERKNKVIIIEDDMSQQLVVQAILEEKFCECFCFSSAEEALAKIDDIHPQVIACDFFLEGGMTGLDFVVHVKSTKNAWHDVPILVMSGLDDPTRKYELVRSGANDYIAKPLDPIDLSVRVENLMRYKHLLDKVEEQKKEMQFLAMHDQLTGLHNRYFVAEHVQMAISEAKRHSIDYSMIVLDIDFFKQVNDHNGHDVGDQVLVAVAAFLKGHIRGSDSVSRASLGCDNLARIGGEEFVILLNHCNLTFALQKAEQLRVGIEGLCPAGLKITASFGVSQLSSELDNFDKLFKAADVAVYQAKNNGRNRVETVKYLDVPAQL